MAAGRVTKVFVEFEAGVTQFNQGVGKARKQLGLFGKTASKQSAIFKKAQSSFKSFAAGLVGIGTAIAALRSAFQNQRSLELLNAQLETATGSAREASLAFAEMRALASQMPNSVEELTTAFINLRNFGLEASKESLISYANTSAALGKSLDQLIQAVADSSTREFERLKEFGVLARNEGDRIRFIFRGTETVVENSSRAIQGYLISLGETAFAGSIVKQMDTINGRLSNLRDAWFNFTTALTEDSTSFLNIGIGNATRGLNMLADERRKAKLEGALDLGGDDDLGEIANRIRKIGEEDRDTLEKILAERFAALEEQGDVPRLAVHTQLRLKREQEIYDLLNRQLQSLERRALYEQDSARNRQAIADAVEKSEQSEKGQAKLRELMVEQGRKDLTGQLRINALIEERVGLFDKLEELTAKFDDGLSDKEIERLAELFNDTSDRIREIGVEIARTKEEMDELTSSANAFADSLAEGLSRGLVLGQKLSDLFRTVITQLATDSLAKILKPILQGPAKGITSGVEKIFGLAEGGRFPSGSPVLVGERGPELILPDTTGKVIPNNRIARHAGGGNSIVVNNQFNIAGSADIEVQRQIAESVEVSVKMAIAEYQNLKARGALI